MADTIHAVGIIFEDQTGNILVLKRHPQGPEGGTWGLVGGKIEPGEDPEAAAIREAREETGYKIDPDQLKFLRSYHWDRQGLRLTFEVFHLRVQQPTRKPQLAEVEHTEHTWMQPHEAYRRSDLMKGLYPILEDFYL